MKDEYINIGKIDIEKYAELSSRKIVTSEVIITYKQIEHINEDICKLIKYFTRVNKHVIIRIQ